jgi:hypothetical protein
LQGAQRRGNLQQKATFLHNVKKQAFKKKPEQKSPAKLTNEKQQTSYEFEIVT